MKPSTTNDAITNADSINSQLDSEPSGIGALFAKQHSRNALKLIIFSNEVESKSTLIGRFLWNTQQLYDKKIIKTKQNGKVGKLAAMSPNKQAPGRENNPDDVSYHFFSSQNRKYILADAPVNALSNETTVAAATTAKVAILLIDARRDLAAQVRRQAYLISLVGIRHVLLAINKIDLVNYDVHVYKKIKSEFEVFTQALGFASIAAIPVSNIKGDNVIDASKNTPWYEGPTLLAYLDAFDDRQVQTERFVFPIQLANRTEADFDGLCGTVAEGQASVGDEIRVTSSGQTAKITSIIAMDGPAETAAAGDVVTLCLDKNIAASRGDIIALAQYPLETTDQFTATIIWFHQDAGMIGRSYDLKLLSQWSAASITSIKHRIDGDTQELLACKQIERNDIVVCNIALGKPLAFDHFKNSEQLGSFILVDRVSKETLACGMILHDLRRAQNVHTQALSIQRSDRERRNGHPGKVIWFTGLSGSGKSTVANSLDVELHSRGMQTYILDGDNVRQGLNKDLGFTEADRVENIRRIAEVAKLMLDAGIIVMTAFISPFRREREMARDLIGAENFIEVYVSTPLEVCETRDVKGLYKKARDGKIPNMTGINSPYEIPDNPSYVIDHDLPIESITKDLALHVMADN